MELDGRKATGPQGEESRLHIGEIADEGTCGLRFEGVFSLEINIGNKGLSYMGMGVTASCTIDGAGKAVFSKEFCEPGFLGCGVMRGFVGVKLRS